MIRGVLDRFYEACGYLAAAFMVGIGLAIIAQIAGRMRGITVDATEAAGLCLAASTFFGLAHTFRRGGHVRINLIVDRLPERWRHKVEVLNCLLGTVVVSFLAWHVGALALQSHAFNDVSPGLLAMPFWIPQGGVAIGIAALAIAFIDELVWLLGGGRPRYGAPDEIELDRPVA
ncbi:MAG: TRAP transporter small permease [Bosea sp.]|uniref:TRAP transporter small permease n=1 Tax=unclassified Bosea (in: a-proteobacteria) TaxID=2653178 RepID=UPI000A63FFC2|nr:MULTISPECIES: TRAP transporter small permease [unclassified Bosea (in: a-proteobacteria)]MBN9458964.1 TRAP transporter small permease [Bosea sp. (in: a-proteobacteria)]